MLRRLLLGAGMGGLLLTVGAMPHGGWAITTVTDVPEYLVAGKTSRIAYVVRQHGQELRTDLRGRVTAWKQSAIVSGEAQFVGGQYVADLVIPSAGEWKVRIENGFNGLTFDLPAFTVIASDAPPPPPMTPVARGEQLFQAKGCASCHAMPGHATPTFPNGPVLSPGKLTAGYVAKAIADPSTIVRQAGLAAFPMPNLRLAPEEITALTAYVTRGR